MSLLRQLSVLAICQVMGDRADSLMGFVGERFRDHGTRLEGALGKASERAWRCLEVALAGERWWKSMLAAKDEQTLQRQIRLFLKSLPATELPGDADKFRTHALAELKAARKAGLIPGGGVRADDVASAHARVFARYGDPQSLLDRDRHLLAGLSGMLAKEGYANLARYVGLCPAGGQPLLVQAVRYFFRREVEGDERLATGLTMEKLDGLDGGMRAGFDDLHEALEGYGDKLEAALTATQAGVAEVSHKVSATLEAVSGTRDEVKTLREKMEQQQEQLRQLTAMLGCMLDQQPPMAPAKGEAVEATTKRQPDARADSKEAKTGFFALASGLDQGAGDWAQVRQLLARVQRISPEEQRGRPELRRVVDQVTEAVRRVETTRRTILNLEQTRAGKDPTPAAEEESGRDVVPEAPPKGEKRRATGRLISPLFQKAWQAEAKENRDPPAGSQEPGTDTPRSTNRLLSPLFDEKPEEGTGDAEMA